MLSRNRCSFRLFFVSLVHFLLFTSLLPTSRGHFFSFRCGRLYEHCGTSEDLGEFAPLVQILDLLVPQTVDHVIDALRMQDRPLAE